MQNKMLLAIAVVVVIGIAAYALSRGPADTGNTGATVSPGAAQSPLPSATPDTSPRTIEMTSEGFWPPTLEIPPGTLVNFINKDTANHLPASDPHPAHTACPGFEAQKAVKPGETFPYTFNEVKTCPFHDHLNPAMKGTISVK